MKIHEYQAKEILRRYGVATPKGRVTDNAEEAASICEALGGRCVVKAQIHAGGRGKGGGVKLAKSPEEAREIVRRFGECMHAENGNVAVSLQNGAADVAPIVRALDEAGLLVESLEVIEPTLDDVFLALTAKEPVR